MPTSHLSLVVCSTLLQIERLEGLGIAQVEGGLHFSCFLDGSGKRLYVCGRGDYGSLGITLAQADPGYLENVPRRVPLVYEPAAPVANSKENCIVENDIDESQQPEIAQISCG